MLSSARMEARGPWIRTTGSGLLVVSLLLCGCVGTPMWPNENAPPPPCVASSLVTIWKPEVRFEPNPFQGGAPFPGIAGRIHLFCGDSALPVVGDGELTVEFWDATGKPEVLIEMWVFDKDTLKRSLKKDAIGWGYTLFLPWNKYSKDITKAHLRVIYKQGKGNEIYSQDPPMALNHVPIEMTNTSTVITPPVSGNMGNQMQPAQGLPTLPMPSVIGNQK